MHDAPLADDLDLDGLRDLRDLGVEYHRDLEGAPLQGRGDRGRDLDLRLRPQPEKVVVVPGRPPRAVAGHVAELLDVDELVVVRPGEDEDGLQLLRRSIEQDAPDSDGFAPVDGGRGLAVKVDGSHGAVDVRLLEHADAVGLAHAEDVEVEVVGRLGERQRVELLAVLVDVGRHPAPVAVADVVKVLEATLPGEAVVTDLTLLGLGRVLDLAVGLVVAVRAVLDAVALLRHGEAAGSETGEFICR